MSGTASGLVLGFLLATAYGAGFHFLMGGPARRIALYLFTSWLGFIVGHYLGNLLALEMLKLGTLNLVSASVGSWIFLLFSWWLAGDAT